MYLTNNTIPRNLVLACLVVWACSPCVGIMLCGHDHAEVWSSVVTWTLLVAMVTTYQVHLVWVSLGPRPPPQLLSLAVRKSRRRPGRVSHVMRAAAYVTDSVNTHSQYSTGYRLFQRRYRDQTNSRGEAGPTYTTYLDLKQNR